MAKKGSTRKRAPFVDRVTNKLTKLSTWVESTKKRFTTEPKGDVIRGLADVEESLAALLADVAKLKDWSPPSRGPAFSVGDLVSFKKEKLSELKKSGLYEDLDGTHEVKGVAGRKVRLDVGVFANVLVTKKAA